MVEAGVALRGAAATEAVNLLIKRIKRVGFGFRNFANYRLGLLLHCGSPGTPNGSEAGHHAQCRRAPDLRQSGRFT